MPFFRIDVAELRRLVAQEQGVVVDIRDQNTYLNGRIPNAIHLTNHNLADFIQQVDDEQPVIVCCYHGISSQPAAEYLSQQGLERVYSLDGGFEAWMTQKQEVEKS